VAQMRGVMHLLLLSGFLGSGKTTFLLQVSRQVIEAGKRVAVVVNEIGEIGVDDRFLRHLGLGVWELPSGCICCTLAGDLVSTLRMLDAEHKPDLVIVEPSGAADPRNLLPLLPKYGGRPLESIKTASVVDPLRIEALLAVLEPLVTSQIRHADVILVSKCDVASPEERDAACRAASELNPGSPVFSLSARDPLTPDLTTELLPWLTP